MNDCPETRAIYRGKGWMAESAELTYMAGGGGKATRARELIVTRL
jgi:hypothetical protein